MAPTFDIDALHAPRLLTPETVAGHLIRAIQTKPPVATTAPMYRALITMNRVVPEPSRRRVKRYYPSARDLGA